MKLIKISIVALVLTISAQFAKAQVHVGANIHIGYNEPYRRVVYEPAYAPVYPVYERPVYYRPAYRRVYYRPAYRRVYYRPGFYGNRGWHGRGHAYGRRWR